MTNVEPLRIVPAGAGSGKTYSIQHQLGEWVAAGKVAPDRIVAVTYTEAAASELRERIGARLVEMGRVDDALRLSEAYISTIHSFGLRVLTEFAFEAGASPQPRLLNDNEQSALIRRALARTDKANAVADRLEGFGYSYSFGDRRAAVDVFRDRILDVVGMLRSIGVSSQDDAARLAMAAAQRVAERYGDLEDGECARQELQASAEALLWEYPDSLHDAFGKSKAAREAFIRDFRSLTAAARTESLGHDWKLWQRLREIRRSKAGNRLPVTYDQLATEVIEAADSLAAHPGPLLQAQEHLTCLLAAGQDVLRYYGEAKRQAGLVDYTDMIAMAGRLLRTRPDVLETLAGRIDCLVVDEFQDTNPLQFALLWNLRRVGVPTLVAGDLKQAIMGFQGADPRLFEALELGNPESSRPLKKNWRSQPRLMEAINSLGRVLFSDRYTPLEAQGQDSPMAPLEVLQFPRNFRLKARETRALTLAERCSEMLADPAQQIIDRQTKKARRLRGGDIAVLCPTHSILAAYANTLRGYGLRVNCQADGWLASRPVQLAWHALSYLANSADRHAALYLAVTELGQRSLEEGLGQIMRDGRIEDPLVRKLDELADGVADRTVYALLADTLDALDLWNAVSVWPDSEQARANLVQLMGAASEFMNSNREALAYGGYHGSGIQTFLAWLAEQAQQHDQQPDKRVLEEDAIVLRTWHSAKGLEWPVVAVCGIDRKFKVRLPSLDLGYESFEDLDRILEHARVEFWPEYVAPENNRIAKIALLEAAETEARRLLYVALTRARDRLVLEWPSFLERDWQQQQEDGPDLLNPPAGKSYWALLRPRCSLNPIISAFVIDGQLFPCRVTKGYEDSPGEDLLVGEIIETELPLTGRRAIRVAQGSADLTPDSLKPSLLDGLQDTVSTVRVRVERYGQGLNPEVGLVSAELGTYLHRCFEFLGPRPDLAGRMAELTGVEADPAEMAAISKAVARFEAWLSESLRAEQVLREWPLLMLDRSGSVVSGTVDLLVKTPDGAWILDHKSDYVEDPAEAMQKYQRQLGAYEQALAAQGTKVLGVGINWIRRGAVTWKGPLSATM